MSTTELAWFKSSYSGTEGDNCVEVALEWRKSTYSGTAGDNCIEVAATPRTIHVRDSKDTTRSPLGLHPSAWAAFVPFAAAQAD
ncbi:DUF397 domain-containing protein [Streptomyces ossamyceticus]|uniref:DUF397 domain-containing protein n=1 Tax=Streptomyces ossamyceticus TaxID=249581 RepID=UPI0006E290AE|nr:DUF397 domain-containing protein [Streptomyces ossamyceticus]